MATLTRIPLLLNGLTEWTSFDGKIKKSPTSGRQLYWAIKSGT